MLRPLSGEDKVRLFVWRNSPDVAKFMYTPHMISPAEHDRWWAGLPGATNRKYWIIEADAVPVGLINLTDLSMEHARGSWAFYLADPSSRGRGIGSGAGYLVLRYAFEDLALHKLGCEVLSNNLATVGLHLSAGFAIEGIFRQHIVKDGGRLDVLALALLAPDWPAVRDRLEDRLARKGIAGRLIEE
jgi:UDP-4-amino-4,6-dideoxy-N-acetyl-beta-L-altrosamine N-acetyltransferase